MRILHCYRTYFPDTQGGGEEAIRQIMLSTCALGFENTVFALSKNPMPQELRRPEARVIRNLSWAAPASCDLGTWRSIRSFRELVREHDLVHFHFPWPFADILQRFGNDVGRPAIATYHSDIVRQRVLGALYRPSMLAMLRSMSAVVATSDAYVKSSEVLSTHVPPEKIHMVPLGISEESYGPAIAESKGVSLQGKFNLTRGGYFLTLGVLRYYKGLHVLVAAAKDVDMPIVIAGDGPMKMALQTAAQELPVGRVRFVGWVSDAEKMALIAGCRAFVLPSHLRSEAFGMVLIEAAMLGRPMISCEIGTGTSFVNRHGETGLVVAPENAAELAGAMNRFVDDKAFGDRCGQLARSRYEAMFSGAALGRGYASIYSNTESACTRSFPVS